MRQEADTLARQNIEVLVIGPEKKETFRKYWEKEALPFVGLPDPEHSVMKLYGQEVKLLKLGRMPAQMLIDTKGVIRYVHYGSSMADIPDIREVIDALRDDVLYIEPPTIDNA